MTDCAAISDDGLVCTRGDTHIGNHKDGDVHWADTFGDRATLCLAVTDEPGPLPSRCNRGRDHDGDHTSTEHRRVLHTWKGDS